MTTQLHLLEKLYTADVILAARFVSWTGCLAMLWQWHCLESGLGSWPLLALPDANVAAAMS